MLNTLYFMCALIAAVVTLLAAAQPAQANRGTAPAISNAIYSATGKRVGSLTVDLQLLKA